METDLHRCRRCRLPQLLRGLALGLDLGVGLGAGLSLQPEAEE